MRLRVRASVCLCARASAFRALMDMRVLSHAPMFMCLLLSACEGFGLSADVHACAHASASERAGLCAYDCLHIRVRAALAYVHSQTCSHAAGGQPARHSKPIRKVRKAAVKRAAPVVHELSSGSDVSGAKSDAEDCSDYGPDEAKPKKAYAVAMLGLQ